MEFEIVDVGRRMHRYTGPVLPPVKRLAQLALKNFKLQSLALKNFLFTKPYLKN